MLLGVTLLQAVIGFTQYYNGIPALLVGAHMLVRGAAHERRHERLGHRPLQPGQVATASARARKRRE